MSGSKWLIGNGASTDFRFHPWLTDLPLIDQANSFPSYFPKIIDVLDANGNCFFNEIEAFLPNAVVYDIRYSIL